MMTLTRTADRWTLASTFDERHVPKAAGFRWDPAKKTWYTQDADKAAKLARFADETCQADLNARQNQLAASLAASRAVDADIDIPVPDSLAYMPFQKGGVAFGASRPSTLFADDMGLGKTIQAIGVSNADASIRQVLIICPATLRLNWSREWTKWSVRSLTVGIAQGDYCPDTDVVIVNYDILHRHVDALALRAWDLLVVDEAHYVKNDKARRSKAVYALKARRRLALTGTPIVNRPKELFPIIHWLDPQTWPKFFPFAMRYCGATKNRFGWDFDGATHLDELQTRLRSTIMVRRKKQDVLVDLPAKRRQVIEIPANGAKAAVDKEQSVWNDHQARIESLRLAVEAADASTDPNVYKAAVAALHSAEQAAFQDLSRLRHDTAVAKVPYVLAHLHDVVDDGDKVVVFAHHHDVVEAVGQEFGAAAVTIYGNTPNANRQSAIDRFQKDPTCKVFVGSITAAGVGITLTAGAHVVFAELDWVPGNVTQAEDRCHRIGQSESVLVQHLVLEGSLDARMARVIVQKQDVADRALDKDAAALDLDIDALIAAGKPADAAPGQTSTQPVKSSPAAAQAPAMTDSQVLAIHRILQMLAGRCDGAVALDGAGFNRYDAAFGHDLAAKASLTPRQAAVGFKLATKYRGQIPQAALEAAGVPLGAK